MPQSTAYRPTPTSPTTAAAPKPSASTVTGDTDDLLDDIDECLEDNALEVVRRFVNRGGQ